MFHNNKNKNRESYNLTRRRAERVPEVAQRYQHHPMLAARTPELLEAANAVIVAYDDDTAYTANTQTLLEDAETKGEALHGDLRDWVAVLASDVPDLDLSRYNINKRSRDDVIARVKVLMDTARGHGEANPALPYVGELTAALEPALAAAEAANDTAKNVRATRRLKRQVLSEAAHRLHRALIGYRRVLRRVIGQNHPDYLALRARSGGRNQTERKLEPVANASSTSGSEPAGEQ